VEDIFKAIGNVETPVRNEIAGQRYFGNHPSSGYEGRTSRSQGSCGPSKVDLWWRWIEFCRVSNGAGQFPRGRRPSRQD